MVISGTSGCRVLFDGCGETIPNRREYARNSCIVSSWPVTTITL